MAEVLPYPTAILLDWDGTICDSLQRVQDVLNGIQPEFGLPPIDMEQTHESTMYGKRFGQVLFGMDDADALNYYNRFAEKFFVFDGQVTLLEHAENFILNIPATIPVGIVSNSRGDLLRSQIKHLGWSNRFGAIVAIDEAPKNKPAPDAALFALEKLGVAPNKSVWFVGDTRGDIECAHAAGLTSILLKASQPIDCTPHHRFADCSALRKHFSL